MQLNLSQLTTQAAMHFATRWHAGQKYSDLPYIFHVSQAVLVLKRFKRDDPTQIQAMWLHDVVEDTSTTLDDISLAFGPEVAVLVDVLTNQSGSNRKEKALLTYPRIRAHGQLAIECKLADRISHMEHILTTNDDDFRRMYFKERDLFKELLYVPGQSEDMWEHLGHLYTAHQTFDGRFQAFQMLGNFVEEVFPEVRHFSAEQAEAVRKYAEIIAKTLLKPGYGRYVYEERPPQ